MVATGVAYAVVHDYAVLLIVAFAGTINPTSGMVSVFAPLEHAVLARTVADAERTRAFARYSLCGALAGALGALAAATPDMLAPFGIDRVMGIKLMFVVYALLGLLGGLIYAQIPPHRPAPDEPAAALGPSRVTVYKLAALFSIDSFASGFTIQSLLALWLFEAFDLSLAAASLFFFWTSLFTAFSFPVAAWLSRHIGLVNTMVFTHIPANLCIILAAFAPTLPVALGAAAGALGAGADGRAGALILCDGGGHAGRARRRRELHLGSAQPCHGGEPGTRRRAVRDAVPWLAADHLRRAEDRLRFPAAVPVPAREAAGGTVSPGYAHSESCYGRDHSHLGNDTMTVRTCSLAAALALCCGTATGASGQPAAEFYKNRQMRLIVGHVVGNDYDVGARLLAKYLQKHIPGQPTIIPQNMTAASSVVAANYVYGQAPRDGSVIGTFSRNIPNQSLMGQSNIEADPRRFNWLGATSLPGRICAAWHMAPVKSVADLLKQELIVGSSGSGTSNSILPTVANHVLGTKFRIIEGYRGSQDVILAIERGEVQGLCATTGQFRPAERLFKDGKLRVLFRSEEAPLPEFPDVPSLFDYLKADDQRYFVRFVFGSVEFGRPYVFAPQVPKDRVDLVRRAVAAAARDPDLIAEAAKIRLDMSFTPPERLEQMIAGLYATPPAVIEAVKKIVPNLQ